MRRRADRSSWRSDGPSQLTASPSHRPAGACPLIEQRNGPVQALLLAAIAAVYVGFAVADGRPKVIAVECTVAGAFVLLAAAGVTGSAWLLVVGYTGHGLKDFWQERTRYVANTRWWPPFCAAIDWLVAAVLAVEIAAGVGFHH
jgi:hypothetical protein